MNNKKVRTIASIMIVLLALLLIIIFVSYNNREYRYTKPINMHVSGDSRTESNSGEVVNTAEVMGESGDNDGIKDSGEQFEEIIIKSGEDFIDEDASGEIIYNEEKPPKPKKPRIKNPSPEDSPIIVSRTETSNQEKQEVLNEIDDALKDLLDAVGKVQTVDESKLDASLESEVEP